MTEQILAGYTVVDFTHIFSGPYCTQFLGDLGATVIKIERVGSGDAARTYGVRAGDDQVSGSFLALNRNKKSLAVDLTYEEGRTLVRQLIGISDVLVENFRDGVMRRFGFDYESLSPDLPGLVYCSITGFGATGPLAKRAANDLIVQAYSGLLSMTGEVDGPPVRCGTAVSDFSAGLSAALGVMSALLHRARTGRGQHVETSMLESQISIMNYFFVDYWLRDVVPRAMGTANSLGMPNQVFPTSDGYVAITAANDRMWERCCAALGEPDLAGEPRFATLADRYQNRSELVAVISGITSRFSTAECVERLEAGGVSCAPINTIDRVAADSQLAALGLVVDVEYDGQPHQAVGNQVHFSATPWSISQPAPTLGADSRQVAADLGYSDSSIDDMIQRGVLACPA